LRGEKTRGSLKIKGSKSSVSKRKFKGAKDGERKKSPGRKKTERNGVWCRQTKGKLGRKKG